MHAELLHRLELLGALDAFGDHHRAVIVREPHHRLDEILLDEVRVDRVDQRDVELDEVRLEVGDRAEARVAAARVVDGEAEAALAERLEPLAEFRVVLDRRALGDLDDDALRILDFVLVERRIAEVVRVDVEEQQLVRLQPRAPSPRSRGCGRAGSAPRSGPPRRRPRTSPRGCAGCASCRAPAPRSRRSRCVSVTTIGW